MTDYKLVPVEPTPEMLQAACDEEQCPLPMWSRMKAIYTAMLAAAPAVQGEPVGWRSIKEEKPADGQDCITKMKHGIIQGTYCSEDDAFSGYYWRNMEWYATHWAPAEEAIYTHPHNGEQGGNRTAPDVARLVGKVRTLVAAGNRLNAEAQECTYDDGAAEVASVDFWCEFRDALEAATEALAAHRKQQENK